MNLWRLIVTEFIPKNNCSTALNGNKQTEFLLPHQDLDYIFFTATIFYPSAHTGLEHTSCNNFKFNMPCDWQSLLLHRLGATVRRMINVRQNELHEECKQSAWSLALLQFYMDQDHPFTSHYHVSTSSKREWERRLQYLALQFMFSFSGEHFLHGSVLLLGKYIQLPREDTELKGYNVSSATGWTWN